MKIFEADETYLMALNTFYLVQGYHSDWGKKERAFIATDNNQIVGAVKIELNYGVSVLRGMYISKKYQSNGLGTAFIKHIEPILNQTVSYCMPFSHLRDFYSQIGFKVVNPESYPAFLAKRYYGYESKGYKVIAMYRENTT
ncbi:GNAT family N-acetyltransferase [Pseudoalteromonas denitrificans]|uniref:Acetyltransferase (GNAT) domain-containing protein n=1 Tax=Pseudoalteromonas denitrificans DSM 6059 TaxID=1123010 RepID=A0A1I1SUW8_9GAMM|nr:GNAT family N-acetyltransferase [Pseudoalteromonas denitrificans]SFD50265.1 Acetyltransferase (GNAT) domain-containing protein [Pseudoalteromonas denitrificans DSM 6059]